MSAGFTPGEVLRTAEAEVGYRESRGNRNKYSAHFGFGGQAWCSDFVWWVLVICGCPVGPPAGLSSVQFSWNWWQQNRRTVAKADIRPGDVLHFKIGRRGNPTNHVGFATSAPYKRRFRWVVNTIEGNTNGSGSRTGGGVWRKTRPLSQVVGVARPPYDQAQHATPNPPPAQVIEGDKPARLAFWFSGVWDQGVVPPTLRPGDRGGWVEVWQGAWAWVFGGNGGPIDGAFGDQTAETVRWVQGAAGQPQTGIADRDAWKALRFCIHAKASGG